VDSVDREIKRAFDEEVREKKKTASGAKHLATRTGKRVNMRTPVDNLKGKAKREYMTGGKKKGGLIVYNVNDKIVQGQIKIKYEDLKGMPKEEQKEFFQEAEHQGMSREAIAVQLGLDKKEISKIHNYFWRLGLSKKKEQQEEPEDVVGNANALVELTISQEIYSIRGIYKGAKLARKMLQLAEMVDDEAEAVFTVEIKIKGR
jgi:hypothetical protein